MSPERFEHLYRTVGPYMKTRRCRNREPIANAERLVLTLRYLASGDSQQSLSFNFRVSRSVVCNTIRETCQIIWQALSEEYMKPPTSQQDWEKIAKDFHTEWNFPNCLGALDGKHIAIECPGYSGSEYYNYKGVFSIVLMAMCDAKYCFTLVHVGNYGKENDAQIFNNSDIGRGFRANEMQIPSPSIINGHHLPYVIVSDEIFALTQWLMKPFPGKHLTGSQAVFNYRLSRARRTIENCFGILVTRWRIFRSPLKASPEVVDNITRACTCLHKYLRLTKILNISHQVSLTQKSPLEILFQVAGKQRYKVAMVLSSQQILEGPLTGLHCVLKKQEKCFKSISIVRKDPCLGKNHT